MQILRKLIHPYTLLYIATIVFINMAFSYLPAIETPIGFIEPGSVVAGSVFVTRDFMQRSIGHFSLVPMTVAIVLSYLLADPYVAIASTLAFAVSELVDWALYTITKKPFYQRVMLSSLVSTPIDSAVFLYYIGAESVDSFLMMCASKLLASLVIYFWGAKYGDKHARIE